jgi:type IV secretion system protein VirB6
VAKFGLGLLLALGPLFICAALFPATRRFFDGWAGQCLNYAFLTALFSSASAISIQFMTKHLPASFGWTVVAETAFMGVVFVVVAFEMPSMASALAGGVGISSLVSNGVASGVKGAGVGGVKGATGLTRRGFGALRRKGGGISSE